jgi:hypothetical protein
MGTNLSADLRHGQLAVAQARGRAASSANSAARQKPPKWEALHAENLGKRMVGLSRRF